VADLVDDLILLGRGGRLLYSGPMARIKDYFSDVLGYRCPPDTNASDYMMDVLEARFGAQGAAAAVELGKVLPADAPAAPAEAPAAMAASAAQLARCFADVWLTRGAAWVAAGPGGGAPAAADEQAALPGPTASALRIVAPPRASLLSQTLRFAWRGLLQHAMGTGLFLDLISLLLGGCVMGIVGAYGSTYIPPVSTLYFNSCPPGTERLCRFQLRVHLQPVTFYTVICIGVLALPPAVRALGAERAIYWREVSVGVNRGAYYLGKVLAELPKLAVAALAFVAPLVAISHWRAPVETLYFAVLVTMFFITALGFTISALLVAPDAANLLGVNVAVISCLFSGFVPLLGNGAVWCYARWAQRALLAIELMDGWGLEPAVFDRSMFTKEHQTPNWRRDLWILAVIALATYALGFVCLLLRHRDKQR
jgi:hypothetical protein